MAPLPSPPPGFAGLPDLPAIAELQSRRQWVAWNWRTVDGRPTKPPISPHTGLGASHSKPSDWGTYVEAAARAVRSRLPGVGYVMTPDDGLTGADLDKCRDSATGDLASWAADIVALAETYTEVSPSGTGLRLIWRGKVEHSSKADPVHVEIYRDKRYLTITGDHVSGTPTDIRPAPRTLAILEARLATYQAERDQAKGESFPTPPTSNPVQTIQKGRGGVFFRNVNSAALGSLSAWVPSLFGTAAKHQPSTGAYRVPSRALARDLQEDLSIAPGGIVDFGVHDMGDARDGKRTPVDLVLEFSGAASTARDAAFWLVDRLGRSPADFGWTDAGMGGDAAHGAAIAAALVARPLLRHADGTVTDEDGVVVDKEDVPSSRGLSPPDPTWDIGGLGSAIASEAFATARRPSREFAFVSAMAILSVLFGRRFLTPTGSPLNLYLMGISKSGYGKDHALDVVRTFLHETNLATRLLGPSDVTSDSAIEKILRRTPCCVLPLDEVGIFLQGMSGNNAGSHERRIRKALLELYSLGRSVWSGKETADPNKDMTPIWCPTLSFLGFSTPTELFEGVQERNLTDGFLARMIFVPLTKRPNQNNHAPSYETSSFLKDATKRAITPSGGNLSGISSPGMRPILPRVPWADAAASSAFDDLAAWQDKVVDADEATAGYVNRAAENALRMATLKALSRGSEMPMVTRDDVVWAESLIRYSLYSLDEGLRVYMADSDFERAHKIAFEAILAAGTSGMPEAKLRVRRGISKLDERTYEGVIKFLTTTSQLVVVKQSVTGRRGRRFFPAVRDVEPTS